MRHILISDPSPLSIRTSDYLKTGSFLSGWATVSFLKRSTSAIFVTISVHIWVKMARQFSNTHRGILVITLLFINDDRSFISKNTPLFFFVDKKVRCRSDSLGR